MKKTLYKNTPGGLARGWNILLRHLLEYRSTIVLLSILGVISAIANAAVPYLVGMFLDALLASHAVRTVAGLSLPLWAWILGGWGATQLVANVVDWIIDNERRRIGTFLYAEYPARAAVHLLRLPLTFHKETKIGVIWDRIVRARDGISNIVEHVVVNLAPQFLRIIVGFAFAFFISWKLSLILVAGITFYTLLLVRIVPPIVEYQRRGHRAWNRAYGDTYDSVANVETVKHATAERYEERKIFDRFVRRAARIWFEVEKIWSGISFYQRMVVLATQLAVFAASVYLVRSGTLTIGELIALNGYAAMVFGPFVTIGHNWQTLQGGLVSIERAEKILDLDEEPYRRKHAENPSRITGRISFENVTFAYKRGQKVLDEVSFTVEPGQVVALVGESGAGKSTLINLISGYFFPTKGRVLIDGVNTRVIDLSFLRKSIAVVPQEVVLFNDTLRGNIAYGNPDASARAFTHAAHDAHVDVFASKFKKGYEQVVGERGVKLSVGQKQRVAIARAILRDPHILILDEPTSALDLESERYIAGSLERLMRGRTTFIIAHRLSTVRRADLILVLADGRIAETGKHDELIGKPKGLYHRLYDLHLGLRE